MLNRILGIALAVLAVSCTKDVQDTQVPVAGASTSSKKCAIARIVSYDRYLNQTITFQYNSDGAPVSVTPSSITTGSPQLLFRYDNKGRLTDFIGVYKLVPGGGFEYWHKYGYNNRNRIVVDTTYSFGTYGLQPTNSQSVGRTEFEYDGEGRVIKLTYYSPVYPAASSTFTYDANGNLVRPGVTYDDQVSLFSTNPVWMFIFRNYSRNNAITASAYNRLGLPLTFTTPEVPRYAFTTWPLNSSVIEYECN